MPRSNPWLLASLLALGGCGGPPPGAPATAGEVAAIAADDAGESMAGDSPLAPVAGLAAAHLDPLAQGIAAENARLEQTLSRLQDARDDAARLVALAGIEAERLDAVGAEAAGLAVHDYRRLRDALYEHLGAIETRTALEAEYGDPDTRGMDAATAAEARRQAGAVMAALPDPYADLDPALADALRARQGELLALRNTYIQRLFRVVDGP